jgi:hypothetical protein
MIEQDQAISSKIEQDQAKFSKMIFKQDRARFGGNDEFWIKIWPQNKSNSPTLRYIY